MPSYSEQSRNGWDVLRGDLGPTQDRGMMTIERSSELRRAPSPFDDLDNVHEVECGAYPHCLSMANVGRTRPSFVGIGHNLHMEAKNSMGMRVRKLRKARKLTQQVAAAAIGISRAHLTKIETNKDGPSRATLNAIAVFFGTTMDYLESGTVPSGADPSQYPVNSDDELAWAKLGSILNTGQKLAVARFVEDVLIQGPAPTAPSTIATQAKRKK